jgi:serine phosphatase RsbU (regulator of sigma subunit)
MAGYSDVAELTLINPGDILFLYTDGVYDGSDEGQRRDLGELTDVNSSRPAREICGAILEYAIEADQQSRDRGEKDRIDDKTVFIVKWNGLPDEPQS